MKKTENAIVSTYEASLPSCPLHYEDVASKVNFDRYASFKIKNRRKPLFITLASVCGTAAIVLAVVLPLALTQKQLPKGERDKILFALDGVESALKKSQGAGLSRSNVLKKEKNSEASLSKIKSYLVADDQQSDPNLSPDDYPFAQFFFARDILESASSFENGETMGNVLVGTTPFDFTNYEESSTSEEAYQLTAKAAFSLLDDGSVEVGGAFFSSFHEGAITQIFPYEANIVYDFTNFNGDFTMTLLSGDCRTGFPGDHQESTYEYAYLSCRDNLVVEYRHFVIVSKTPLIMDEGHPSFQNYLNEGVVYVDEAEIYDGERYSRSQRTGIADAGNLPGIKENKHGIGLPIVDDFSCNETDLHAAEWQNKTYVEESDVLTVISSLETKIGTSLVLNLLDENGRSYNFDEVADTLESVSLGDELSLNSEGNPNLVSQISLKEDTAFQSLFETPFDNGGTSSLLCFASYWESQEGVAKLIPLSDFSIYVEGKDGVMPLTDLSLTFREAAALAYSSEEASSIHNLLFYYDYPSVSGFDKTAHSLTVNLNF